VHDRTVRPLAVATLALTLAPACGDDLAPPRPDIAARLAALPGVSVTEITPDAQNQLDPRFRYFDLWFEQPVDHVGGSSAGMFQQYASLIHRSDDAPLVVYAGGYNAPRGRWWTEPAALVDANQIALEYRFYGRSHGAAIPWPYLDVRDAQADQHAIVTAMAGVYTDAPRIATGGSKGGENALEAKRLYPDDYAGVVAYVAPVITALPDARYAHVLDDIGLDACRTNLRAAQRAMLMSESGMEARAAALGTYDDVGLGKATETAIVELEFSYWMTITTTPDCAGIPTTTTDEGALFAFLDQWSSPRGYDDASQATSGWQYQYQVDNQLGYPVWEHAHLDDLMQYSYEDMVPFLQPGLSPPAYDPTIALDLADWVAHDADHVMLLDGEWDPWGAGYPASVAPGPDAFRLVVPHGSHWSTGIWSLGAADQAAALDALGRWTGTTAHLPAEPLVRALPELGPVPGPVLGVRR
jgi:hypothetical protein